MSPSARKRLLAIQKDKLKNKWIINAPNLYKPEIDYFQQTQYFNNKKINPSQVQKEYQIRQNSKLQLDSKEGNDGHKRHFSSLQTQRNNIQGKTTEGKNNLQAQRGKY